MNLTTPQVAKLALSAGKNGKKDQIIFDDAVPGFGIRIRESGTCMWVFQYKIGTQNRRMTLGAVSALSLAKAREIAGELHARVRLGEDPAADKAETRARAAETFGSCVRNYLAWKRNEIRPSSYRDVERHLVRNLAPLHGLPITSIGLREIAAQLTRIAASAPVQANRTRESLSGFFSWALGQGLVETNPALLAIKNSEAPRKRVLTAGELRSIWNALPESDFGDILKLLLLTGQREREIGSLRWSEVNLTKKVIELPGERTKNHRDHVVPLSAPALAILNARPRYEDRDLIFGIGDGGYSGWWRAKAKLDRQIKIPAWVVHDLRRSCATHMAEIGIQPHIIEAILNHVSGHKAGVAGIYNQAVYATEKATALARWAEHVAAVVEGRGSNVTPLRA